MLHNRRVELWEAYLKLFPPADQRPPQAPREVDPTRSLREALIARRNQALYAANFEDGVLFSHIIIKLGYLEQLEDWVNKQ